MDTKTKTHKAQILEALTWECTVTPVNPDMEQDLKFPMAHWYVVVSNKNEQHMNFHCSMGSGLCEQWMKRLHKRFGFNYKQRVRDHGPVTPKEVISRAQKWGMKPSNDDIALCLCNIALDGEPSFLDFCDALGYDSDSIKAHNTWEICLKQEQDLMRLFRQTPEWWEEAREEIDQ